MLKLYLNSVTCPCVPTVSYSHNVHNSVLTYLAHNLYVLIHYLFIYLFIYLPSTSNCYTGTLPISCQSTTC